MLDGVVGGGDGRGVVGGSVGGVGGGGVGRCVGSGGVFASVAVVAVVAVKC